ncbi:MAG: hypothetical protein ACXW09_11910 [Methylococcaceae bacterium]
MSLKSRLAKIERKHHSLGPALIVLNDGETQEQALQRCYPKEKPDKVIFLDEADALA